VHLNDLEVVQGQDELGSYLESRNLKELTSISVESLFNHYFLSQWASRSYRLHFEPTDCFAGALARDRGQAPPSALLNLEGVGGLELCAGTGQFMAAGVARGLEAVYAADSDPTARWLLQTFSAGRLRVG